MNRIYRLVWSPIHKVWIPVAEIARGRSKGSSRKLFAAALSLSAAVGHTEPIGGQVISGSGSIEQSGSTTTIHQSSPNLSVNWQGFNVAPSETVNFAQPSTSAIAVNRIADTNGTQILGHLNANGQVYLINPNGIVFGQGAQVNVGGLVASTLDVNDASLNTNSRTFSGNGTGSVVNKGAINAAGGGSVALLGNHVSNQGTITAQLGTVALGAGSAVTLTFNDNNLTHLQVDQSVLNSLAENGGLIQADGGQVFMTAGARDTLQASVVNNTGVIEARTVNNHEGVITLLGGMEAGTVNVGGTLDASAPNGGNGGFIETSAAHVHVADNARVTTNAPSACTEPCRSGNSGTWLIDPVDFTIAASGGDMTGAAVNAALAGGNFTIMSTSGAAGTTGNVNVNDVVAWSVNKLTLNAFNNININANLNASGTASLALEFGQGDVALDNTSNIITANGAAVNLPASTTNFTTLQGSDGVVKNYTVITSLGSETSNNDGSLQGMGGDLAANYALGGNIDATSTSTWNSGAGFVPVGNYGSSSTPFTGTFDGLGHTISNLTINRPATPDYYVGLFGVAGISGTSSAIRNVGLVGINMIGNDHVGGLAGASYGAVSNSYSTGSVSGSVAVGGLLGSNYGGVSRSYSTSTVSGFSSGGLAGIINHGWIINSYATGSVSGGGQVGGLVGHNYAGTINNSYATGNVTGTGDEVGGLIGSFNNGTVSNSYSTGSVSGVGTSIGGLVGTNAGGSITNSFWDTDTSGTATGVGTGTTTGITGMTTAQMQTQSNFSGAGWDFANTWVMYEGHTSPLLRSFMTALTVTANNATKTYDRLAYSGSGGVSYSITPNSNLLGTVGYSSGTNAGSYAIAASGLYSNQQGYIISYVDGVLTVNPKAITVSGESASNKVYDGTTAATLTGGSLVGVIAGDSVTLTEAGAFSSKNAGTGVAVTASDSLGSTDAGNYTLTQTAGLTADITKKTITVTGESAGNKVYDGTTAATLSGGSLFGVIAGDSVTLTEAGAFSSKNVGTGIAVTASDSLGSTDAGNYVLTQTAGLTANITQKAITVTATGVDKVYDGSVNDAALLSSSGVVGGDSVTFVDTSATFLNKNVGNAKTVSVSGISASGADAGNYSLNNLIASTTASITPAFLSVIGETAGNKIYDGTTAATLTGGSLVGVIAGDSVTLTEAGAFASKNAGTNVSVIASDSLGSTDAGNYTIVQPSGLTANITQKTVAVTGESATNKTYDGTTAATLTGGSLGGVIAGDSVTLNQAGVFGFKNVGAGITVTASDSLGSTDAGNYALTQSTGLMADITAANLIVTGNAASKTYDGAAYSGGNGVAYSGFVNGETNAVLGGVLSYGGSSQGAIDIGDYFITPKGLSSGNYAITYVDGALTIAALPVPTPTPTPTPDPVLPQTLTPTPDPVRNVTALLTSNLSSSSENSQSGTTTESTQDSDSDQDAGEMLPLFNVGKDVMSIGENGPTIVIEDGGVKLPDNI